MLHNYITTRGEKKTYNEINTSKHKQTPKK